MEKRGNEILKKKVDLLLEVKIVYLIKKDGEIFVLIDSVENIYKTKKFY